MKKIFIFLFAALLLTSCTFIGRSSNSYTSRPIDSSNTQASSTHIFADGLPSSIWSEKYKFYLPVTSPLEDLYSYPDRFYSFITPDLRHDLQMYFIPVDKSFSVASNYINQRVEVSNIQVKSFAVELTQYRDGGNILTMASFKYSPSLKVVMIGRNLSKQNIVEMIDSVGNSFDNPKLY